MIMESSKNDCRFLELAAEEACKSHVKSHKHGCVAVVSGKIVARGYNNYRTTSNTHLLDHQCWTCHAEIDVLMKCVKKNVRYKKIKLYVVRASENGNMHLSRPCYHCYRKMLLFPIKYVVYSIGNHECDKVMMEDFSSQFTTSGSKGLDENRIKKGVNYVS